MSNSNRSGGIGLMGILFVVFLVLKLIGKIDWSWWWVTAPLWGPWALVLAVGALVGIVLGIGRLISSATPEGRERLRKRRNLRNARRALDDYANSLTRPRR